MERFWKDGYLVIEDLFSDDELSAMKNAGIQLTKDLPSVESRALFNTTQSPQVASGLCMESSDKIRYFFECGALDDSGNLLVSPELALNKVGHALHDLHPVFRRFSFDERIKEICWQLKMKNPALVQSMYIYKNPGIGSEVTPHQDGTFLHTNPEDKLLGIWIALDDATAENGCLCFIPGSHKSGVHRRFIRNPDLNSDDLLIYTSPPPVYPSSAFVRVPVKRGSCVLIHGLVVHRSDANLSDKSRHAYTFHVIDSEDCQYSKDNWLQLPNGKDFPQLYKQY